jgi:hypothetical protein
MSCLTFSHHCELRVQPCEYLKIYTKNNYFHALIYLGGGHNDHRKALVVPGKTLWRPEQLWTFTSGHPSHAGHSSTYTFMTIRVDNHTIERCHCNRTIRLSHYINSVTLNETQFGHPDAF